ncbi:calcium-binding protein CP1-like [Dendrobium catenatum]|uniref:Calmodulin-like protein 11 n=1 Tax=Dendrobium catenatum TaxID=906689 RepID=A0A2I0X4V6_9ASPA|nr:calcium-binding protein CP1-like [Dendrobium catenatum]PKU82932.1 Calmodulin-like protein 11 [Dendrobium catenatum]
MRLTGRNPVTAPNNFITTGSHVNLNLAAQTQEIQSAFDVLDADSDGRISRDDLRSFFSRFPAASDEVICAMISAADTDRNGYVEFAEFESILHAGGGCVAGDGIMDEAFRMMDRDGDGRVGFEDLKAYLRWAGMPADDEDVREMICSGGCDEASGVAFDDLLRILAVDSGKIGW